MLFLTWDGTDFGAGRPWGRLPSQDVFSNIVAFILFFFHFVKLLLSLIFKGAPLAAAFCGCTAIA